ncbi:unnamed protein product, partial [Protopolystoma xenopodis]
MPTIPVSLLKKRKSSEKDVIKAQRLRSIEIRKRSKKFRNLVKTPAHFINVLRQARLLHKEQMRLERFSKNKKPIFVGNDAKLGLVVRLKADETMPKPCVQIFEVLGLSTINQAIFVKITKPFLELISIIQPYVAWGYPNMITIRNLIDKHGTRKFGILCIEDIIYELFKVGPHFRAVLKFLCPFKLLSPSQGWITGKKRCHASADKLTGYREENINEMI